MLITRNTTKGSYSMAKNTYNESMGDEFDDIFSDLQDILDEDVLSSEDKFHGHLLLAQLSFYSDIIAHVAGIYTMTYGVFDEDDDRDPDDFDPKIFDLDDIAYIRNQVTSPENINLVKNLGIFFQHAQSLMINYVSSIKFKNKKMEKLRIKTKKELKNMEKGFNRVFQDFAMFT